MVRKSNKILKPSQHFSHFKPGKIGRDYQEEFMIRSRWNEKFLRLPLGVTACCWTPPAGDNATDGEAASAYWVTFIAPSWLSSLLLVWKFHIRRVLDSFPTFEISLSPIRYNSDKKFLEALRTLDASTLKQMFRTGVAKATDYVVREFSDGSKLPMSAISVSWSMHPRLGGR